MVISHKYKYVFVALPRSGSTNIIRELCTYYDGKEILKKHSKYHEFLKIATEEEKKYYVFSCIRNPLSRTISLYQKYKDRPIDYFSLWNNKKNKIINEFYHRRRAKFVQNNNADFATFFKRFYKFPYVDWSVLCHKKFDYVIKFENIESDFNKVLNELNIKQVRPLPKSEYRDYLSYYTPPIIEQAKRVYGPFMQEWGYSFPEKWGTYRSTFLQKLLFICFSFIKKLYWQHIA